VHDGRIVLFDFDEFALGDPMEDLAAFVTRAAGGRAPARGGALVLRATRRRRRSASAAARLHWHLAVQMPAAEPAAPSSSRSRLAPRARSAAWPVPNNARPRWPGDPMNLPTAPRTGAAARRRRRCLHEQRLGSCWPRWRCWAWWRELLAPWPLKIIFDHMLLARPLPATLACCNRCWHWAPGRPGAGRGHRGDRAAVGCAVVPAALHHAQARPPHHLAAARELFAHLQRLSLAFHRASRSGELLTKVASDTNLLRDMFADWALTFVRARLTLVAMLAVMFMLNWQLAAGGAATLPPLLA
jgi:hypothetical protein